MSFFKITDPEKRDSMVHEYLMLRNKIRQDSLSEKLGDIDQHRELTKLAKRVKRSNVKCDTSTASSISSYNTKCHYFPSIPKHTSRRG
ncbi:hypothetical protein DPMN_076781 [Dreissena polymorpha]|uniref:Uncharacterized protein n=1 Tax=Dreissena polymorpha TaxID=45954 RepID=A0A9D3YM70_DREPO|nr:hypothetical protein DPMN_076781 [Dreissena polymorpha]